MSPSLNSLITLWSYANRLALIPPDGETTWSSSASCSCEAPSRSPLLTTYKSPISVRPAFTACILSPVCGLNTTTVMSATDDMPTSVWPAPTLSTMTGSNPAYSSTLAMPRTDRATAPAAPLEATLRMYVPESADPDMRTRSPSMAPPVTWLVGSTARTAGFAPSLRSSTVVRSMSVLFPAPAGPVIPIMVALPVRANISATISLAPPGSFSTIEMALAMSPRLPFLRPVSSDASMPPRGGDAIKPLRGPG